MSLTKTSNVSYTPSDPGYPAIPGRPAIPAYCETHYESRCAWIPNPDITYVEETFQYPCYLDGVTLSTCTGTRVVPYYKGARLVGGAPLTIWKCGSVPVEVCHPAQAAIPAVAGKPPTEAQRKVSLNQGWQNGRASSIGTLDIGDALRFTVSTASVGVFIGIGGSGMNLEPLARFQHGLMIDGNGVRVYESGVFVNTLATSFTAATEFVITRPFGIDGDVIYEIDGGSSYTSAVASLGTKYAYASLYSGGDTILDAAFEDAAAAAIIDSLEYMLKPLTMLLAEDAAYEELRMVLPSLTMAFTDDGDYSLLQMTTPAFNMLFAEDADYGELRMVLRPFTLEMTGDDYTPPRPDAVDMLTPPISMLVYDFGPTPDSMAMTTGSLNMILAEDANYGEVRMVMPSMLMEITDVPPSTTVWTMDSVLGYSYDSNYRVLLIVISDGLSITDVFTTTKVLVASTMDTLYGSSSYTVVGEYKTTDIDTLNLSDSAYSAIPGTAFLNDVASVIVVNVDTGALSTYEDYGFFEFYELNGSYYGVAGDGVYLLDSGTSVGDASIGLGKLDFGTAQDKRVPNVYINASSDGKLILKVVVDDGTPYYYEARSSSSTQAVHRVDTGKGLKGNNWEFTLMNQDGDDFDIHGLEFAPVVMGRRI